MLSRTFRRSLLDVRIPASALPPVFLLPSRARCLHSTTQKVEPTSESLQATESLTQSIDIAAVYKHKPAREKVPSAPPPSIEPLALDESIKELLPLLRAQPSHYISAHIHGKPYLVTVGDAVRLPFHMPGVMPGDVLRLNRASALGSRDYTLKGSPYVDERLFECRATIMGTEAEPMRIKTKTKRRNRKMKSVKSKHKYTVLRISELKVNSLEDIQG